MTTSTVKNLSGNYTINSTLVTINGNLIVTGNTTSVQSTNTTITDNIITLNGNVGPSTAPTLNAAIEINRGSSANVQLRWNESYDRWQLTNDGSTFGNISTGDGLSANLNLTGLSIYDTANSVTLYTGTVSSGKSGLFVDNSAGNQQELVAKSASIIYSIIFG